MCCRPISWIKFHYSQNKLLILLADLSQNSQMKWLQGMRGGIFHNPYQDRYLLFISDLFIRDWERAKASIMVNDYFEFIVVVANRDVGFEYMKSFPV